MEKYYAPKFEVYVRMPTFVFDTDKYIEAMVQAVYPWEKTAKGILIKCFDKSNKHQNDAEIINL